MDAIIREGGCRCGAVRFRASGLPRWVAHCHCQDCRRATGAPFATYAGYATDAFAVIAGAIKRFGSSPGVERGFCVDCGSPLTYQSRRWAGEVHVLLGAFDDPGAFVPQAHVHAAAQLPWVKLADGLPRYSTVASDGAAP